MLFRSHIQHDLSRKVILKYTPRLHFKLDQTAAKADRVMSILDTLQVDESKGPDQESEAAADETQA